MNTDKIYAEAIANEYTPKDTSKVLALKKLDKKVKFPPTFLAYTLGVVAALIFGTGMCLSMKVIGDGSTLWMVLGIIIGLAGLALCGVNYLIYKAFLFKRKNKYANDIIKLANEISAEEEDE